MITGRLLTETGELITEISLPENAGEVRLSQYIDFLCVTRKLNDDEHAGNIVQIMAEAISEFCGISLDEVFQAKLGPLYEQEDSVYDNLRGIYGYIAGMLMKFKARLRTEADFCFTVEALVDGSMQEMTFEIPFVHHVALVSDTVLPDVSVGQAVEALELIRLTQDAVAAKGDPDGNLWYSRYLKMMAILTRKQGGEEVPMNGTARAAFYRKRAEFFSKIDLQTALDVDFFLNITLERCGKSHPIAGSLIRPLFGLAVVMSSWKGKHTTVQKRTTKKSLAA